MSASDTRARVLLATVFLKVVTPHLQKYGITISLDDVEDLLMVGAGGWHVIAPYLERYLPPRAKNAAVNTPFLNAPTASQTEMK
jgi:hypothetical protein